MTSKISIDNRELLQKISIGEAAAGIDFGNAIVRELAAFRLAAMDSKPVQMFGIGSIFKPQRVIEQEADCDDCAHYNPKICHGEGCPAISQQSAQPAPVVPDDVLDALQKVARIRLDINDFDGDRRGIADCLGDAEEALIEVVNRRAAMLQELQKSAGASNNCRSGENVQDLLAGNCRENGNSSTNNFREIAETSTGTAITPAAPDKKLTDDVQRDAKRWRALLGSARIRILGSAGFDATAHPGENPDYRHFGMEIWTHYPDWPHEKNEYGINTLIQYADAMLAAAPQLPGSEPAAVPGAWIPVSERMPEDRISVILWDAEIGEVTSGHYSHKTQTFYHCGDAIENEITHWMPPPCAPQEVK